MGGVGESFLLDLRMDHLKGLESGAFETVLGEPKVQAELHMGDGQKGLLGLRLPSARFASLFLLYFIVGRVLLWWKKLESLAP